MGILGRGRGVLAHIPCGLEVVLIEMDIVDMNVDDETVVGAS
jgi:hypothetical protein